MADMNASKDAVTAEQAANAFYMQQIEQKQPATGSVARNRSADWTRSGMPHVDLPTPFPLAGRVGLSCSDRDLGLNFYVGGWRFDAPNLRVISWAAPMAAAFYRNGLHAPLDGEVLVRRTLLARGDTIVDLTDDWEVTPCQPSPFEASPLAVPLPPTIPTLRPPIPVQPQAKPVVVSPTLITKPIVTSTPVPAGLRAGAAVMKALGAPRESQLTSVLSTLQPDQFDLVTRDPNVPLVLQGHPGTGKTIIAVHRAAYLVHEDNAKRVRSVLLVGPTEEYCRHVQRLLTQLDLHGWVTVRSLPEMLAEYAQSTSTLEGPFDGRSSEDVGWTAGSLVWDAHTLLSRVNPSAIADTESLKAIQAVYEVLRGAGAKGVSLTRDADRQAWAKSLPDWKVARRQRGLQPLLAQIGLELRRPKKTFVHLIVDEAQDVRPLEWRILSRFAPSQNITLVGDMNQRRSDFSYHSWRQLADNIGISDGEVPFQPEVIRRGYRSTAPILKFANKLLPAKEREVDCLQTEGPKPRIVKAKEVELAQTVVDEARSVVGRHPGGTTAIISMTTSAVINTLRQTGWRRSSQRAHDWESEGRTLSVLTPEDARGLEFDAVVVVEPSAFPQNLGRTGLLYTSLTRPNRELVVAHAQRMPDALR